VAYERNWAFSFNNAFTPVSAADLGARELWSLKAMLKGELGGLTLGLWTCVGSSDGVTAAMDNVDRWTSSYDLSKIVQFSSGSPHSWIVLRSPLMNGFNWYLMISATAASQATIKMAKTAFAGGSTTADPTSSDSWQIHRTSPMSINSSDIVLHRANICLSATGDFIWFVSKSGSGVAGLTVCTIAPTGVNMADQFPIWTQADFVATGQGGLQSAVLSSAANSGYPTRNYLGSLWYELFPVPNVGLSNQFPDSISGSQIDLPCWVLVNFNSTGWHARGRLPDCGYIPNSETGTPFPSGNSVIQSGNIVYISLGAMFIPANAVPVLS
jgi:hypothetical protein